MPMSNAALAGIERFGHRWKGEINFKGAPRRLSEDDGELKVGDCIQIRDQIVKIGRAFAKRYERVNPAGAEIIDKQLDEIACCEDDPDALKVELNTLYDFFDYYRICVVG